MPKAPARGKPLPEAGPTDSGAQTLPGDSKVDARKLGAYPGWGVLAFLPFLA
jgi:hypothetical protein